MKYHITTTDGPARYGRLRCDNKTITTPHLLYPHTTHISPPSFAKTVIYYPKKKPSTDQLSICIGSSIFETKKISCDTTPSLQSYLFYPKDVTDELAKESLIHSQQNQQGQMLFLPANNRILTDLTPMEKTTIYCIGSAQQLIKQPKTFTRYVTTLRETIGPEHLLYLPLNADPSMLALFVYMGIDFFNTNAAILAAKDNIYLFPTGNIHKDRLQHLPCDCPACQTAKDKGNHDVKHILIHNYYMLENEIALIQQSILQHGLRELVEQRVRSHPHFASILHLMDVHHYSYVEKQIPTQSKKTLLATTRDGLFRPEIIRFQKRLINRFQKPTHASVLLLLPCSARKPYSFSKTHRRFNRIIQSIPNHWIIHEMIITSPLGLVPRELELIYPASSYDISVTGDWYEDERKMIQTHLEEYLKKNQYSAIISHLPSELNSIISSVITNPYVTCKQHKPTSTEALQLLSKTLSTLTVDIEKVSSQKRKKENVTALASYQFGPEITSTLMHNTKITGKYPYHRIIDETGTQLGMMSPQRGFISLTIDGAQRLQKTRSYWVHIADDFTLKGSVFAPGIIDADPGIRIGDEVIILQNKSVKAVGVAQMNGGHMKQISYGEAVKIRHILH